MFRIWVWRHKRATLDLTAAVQMFARPILKCTRRLELHWAATDRNKSQIYFDLLINNGKTPIFMYSPWQNTTTKTCHSLLMNKQGSAVVRIYCQGCQAWWRKTYIGAIGVTQRVQFLAFNSYNWESLADCFNWSQRAVCESATEQPTIDSCTWEGLHGISGNKSCVKIIFWCGALSTYWFVIICTNSGEGGTMPSITVWK